MLYCLLRTSPYLSHQVSNNDCFRPSLLPSVLFCLTSCLPFSLFLASLFAILFAIIEIRGGERLEWVVECSVARRVCEEMCDSGPGLSESLCGYHVRLACLFTYSQNSFHTSFFVSITSHHIISHHITSHHITSHHITSHHITSRFFQVRMDRAVCSTTRLVYCTTGIILRMLLGLCYYE